MVASILVRRLTELIEAGTDRTNQSVDDFTLGEVKRLARTSQSALTATYEVILARLKQPHAQVLQLACWVRIIASGPWITAGVDVRPGCRSVFTRSGSAMNSSHAASSSGFWLWAT